MKINMLESVNLQEKLLRVRNKELKKTDVLDWVQQIFKDVDKNRIDTQSKLETSEGGNFNVFNIDKVEADAIFHINQIKKICIDYRLRFLDTKFFKGEYPVEAISKIHQLERTHNTELDGFKIMAPSVLFRLKKADDPILFAPMGNDYYYLIHKWGNDLHPLRKLKYWAIKNVTNLTITLAVFSLVLSAITHQFFFREHTSFGYFLMLFMFYFKGAVGLTLFYGIALGKSFNEYIWQSKYDKVC
ncbi:hypothetical protein [Tenacibaculum sp. IB213877]|uniref:hypothetical protein n=1 Tax=Tenacibaculum sp. IB213877 TaxID=3097351 RepID=UPI002A5AD615|nr:hypothetical protein [Tenacibaculum sp. IB213877]MDY0779698.1 hypothetical protein [Tenacibaculum sp. IB213877]